MFKIVLCDDNDVFLRIENEIVNNYFASIDEKCQIVSYTNGIDLLNDDDIDEYNLILLDCEMPGISGLEVAERLRKNGKNVPIAFSTNYYDFTIKGYHYGIVRYLVKTESAFKENIIECIEYVRKINRENEYLSIKADGTIQTIKQADIVLISSDKHYLTFYVKNGNELDWHCEEVKARMKFDDIIEELSSRFIRIHQRNYVNMDYIIEIGSYNIIASIGSQTKRKVSMTVRNKKDIQKQYYLYKRNNV